MGDKTRGLYPEGKFIVERRDRTDAVGGKHDGCNYFVLDLTHDTHATPALRAYAESARKDGYELLASDLEQIAAPAPSPVPERWAMFCEHANEVPAVCPCRSDCYCKTHTCKSRDQFSAREAVDTWNRRALAARDAEVREVLEGLRFYSDPDPCWCGAGPLQGDDHDAACLAARALYARLQPGKETK